MSLKAAIATMVGNGLNVGFGAMSIPVTTAGQLGVSEFVTSLTIFRLGEPT